MKTLKQSLDSNLTIEMFFIKLIVKMIRWARTFDKYGVLEYEIMYRIKHDEEHRLTERRIELIEKELSKATLLA